VSDIWCGKPVGDLAHAAPTTWKTVTSRLWRHRVTWRHRWRHQTTRNTIYYTREPVFRSTPCLTWSRSCHLTGRALDCRNLLGSLQWLATLETIVTELQPTVTVAFVSGYMHGCQTGISYRL